MYKKWPGKLEKAVDMSKHMLCRLLQDKVYQSDPDKFIKSSKDMFDMVPKLKQEDFLKIFIEKKILAEITLRAAEAHKKCKPNPSFTKAFIKHVEKIRDYGVLD